MTNEMTKELENIEAIINDCGIYAEVYNVCFAIRIEWGDWKHDHLFLDHIMRENGYDNFSTVTLEEDGSDYYSAVHYYKYRSK